ncbi:MAG: hypothetical protein ACLFM8_08095 [Halobacteriales archaeon]
MPPTDDPQPSGPTFSRRRVLAASGAGLLGLTPGLVGTADGRSPANRVVHPTGPRREALRERALADPAVGRLRRELIENGYRPEISMAAVARTIPTEDPAYHTVAIPFRRHDDAQAVVLWTDQGPFEAQAREFLPRGDDRLELRGHALEGDGVTTTTVTVDPNVWWWICSDLDWACVLTVAGAWASTFAACGACVLDPSKLTCLACIGAVLSAGGSTLGCDICL